MISPKLYKQSGIYDFFMKFLGYQQSIGRFLTGLELNLPPRCRILDAGCGTGLLGLHFLKRFPDAHLVATDLEQNFLHATLANAQRRGIDRRRLEVGIADISAPAKLTSLTGSTQILEPSSIDLLCVGAVVGYSKNIEKTIQQLLALLTPRGYFVNIEMNESPSGRFVSHRYHYHNIALSRMHEIIRAENCDVDCTPLGISHLPAKLTRTAIIARKK